MASGVPNSPRHGHCFALFEAPPPIFASADAPPPIFASADAAASVSHVPADALGMQARRCIFELKCRVLLLSVAATGNEHLHDSCATCMPACRLHLSPPRLRYFTCRRRLSRTVQRRHVSPLQHKSPMPWKMQRITRRTSSRGFSTRREFLLTMNVPSVPQIGWRGAWRRKN